MKSKKSIFFYIVLGVIFSIFYIIFAARPLGKEYNLTPKWKIDTSTEFVSDKSINEKLLPFKLGQTIGYFTEDGKVTSRFTFPFKASISKNYYAMYTADNSEVNVFNFDGSEASVIKEYGFPFFEDDRIFIFLPGGAAFAQYNSDGSRKWNYSGTVPITSFSSTKNGCVAGFANGIVRQFSTDGKIIQEFSPGGSDYSVILGSAISSDNSIIATISGQDKQRFVLSKKEDNQTKIIFHEYIETNSPLQRLIKFSIDDSVVFYNSENMLTAVDIKKGKSIHIKISGQVISMQEENNLLFVLTKDNTNYTVYIIEKIASVIGTFSFDAQSAFICVDSEKLYIGNDTSISCIDISKK